MDTSNGAEETTPAGVGERGGATLATGDARPPGSTKPSGQTKPTVTNRRGRLVGVRMPQCHTVYRFFTAFRNVKVKDAVLLRIKEREAVGFVVFVFEEGTRETLQGRRFVGAYGSSDTQDMGLRVLSHDDLKFFDARDGLEHRARHFCREKIREMNLDMKLSKVSYLLTANKAVFYFTAENRVDFRELVRILGAHLHVRVEMRHVGVRDEAKILGGIGICGNEFCCSKHLTKFHPVSVRMAKNQELSLNPEGISGSCGRLLCCLEYENATYQKLREGLPKAKKVVQMTDGRQGVVSAVHPLLESVTVRFGDGVQACVARCDLSLSGADGSPKDGRASGGGASHGGLHATEATGGQESNREQAAAAAVRSSKRRRSQKKGASAAGAVSSQEAAGGEGTDAVASHEISLSTVAKKTRRRRRAPTTKKEKSV